MKIYTKTGDSGTTGLFGAPRVSKHSPRIEAVGEVDELNAHLGIARSAGPSPSIHWLLGVIQDTLFTLGAELGTPSPEKMKLRTIVEADIELLEQWIDHFEALLPELKHFIIPGGSAQAAQLHLCRAVCRRAERAVVYLLEREEISEPPAAYLNRLSDLLFVLSRVENHWSGAIETIWTGQSSSKSPDESQLEKLSPPRIAE